MQIRPNEVTKEMEIEVNNKRVFPSWPLGGNRTRQRQPSITVNEGKSYFMASSLTQKSRSMTSGKRMPVLVVMALEKRLS